ncbi:hypothetical protein ACS0TY_006560 [Phlomoides rotata]
MHGVDKNCKNSNLGQKQSSRSSEIPDLHSLETSNGKEELYMILESKRSEEARKILEEGHERDSLGVKALTCKQIQHVGERIHESIRV